MKSVSDRNLLFGILALQMDFINRDEMIQAMTAWTVEKHRLLGELLVEQRTLAEDDRKLLEQMVDRHIAMHQGDPEQSLAALSSVTSVKEHLGHLEDPELDLSLTRVVDETANQRADKSVTTVQLPGKSVDEAQGLDIRFQLVRPHAEGGLGRVSVALDRELNREVALKEIKSELSNDPGARNRFTMEAEITGGLEHPGIVPVYGLGTRADGQPFYAMRFIKGDSLKQACKKYHDDRPNRSRTENTIQFRNLLRRFIDVCNAVAYAHSRGVLHRDLKPGNIMLGKYGETLVVDWGLAKAVGRQAEFDGSGETTLRPRSANDSSKTQIGSALGTPRFMSPEQAAGRLDELGPASDVYSLGATLYYLLVNQPAFPDRRVDDVLEKVRCGQFDEPRNLDAGVPRALNAICLQAMRLEPDERYAGPHELAADIDRWLADEPVIALPENVFSRSGRWIRRHGRSVFAAGASLIVISAVSTFAAFSIDGARRSQQQSLDQTRAAFASANAHISAYPEFVSDFVGGNQESAQLLAMRNELLDRSLDYYQSFIESYGSNSDLRFPVAEAQDRLGILKSERGKKSDAVEDMKLAIYRWEQLVRATPDALEARERLANAHVNLGATLAELGKLKEALSEYEKATLHFEGLSGEFPEKLSFLNSLADVLDKRGVSQAKSGDLDSAIELYEQAAKVYEGLIAQSPLTPEYRAGFGSLCSNFGVARAMRRQPKEARSQFQRSVDLAKQLIEAYPNETSYKNQLGGYLHNLARACRDLGDTESCEKHSLEGIGQLRELVEAHPGVVAHRTKLTSALSNYANFLRDIGRRDEALKIYRQSIAECVTIIAAQPGVPDHKNVLARLHNNLGRLLESESKIDEALQEYVKSRDLRQQLVHAFPDSTEYRQGLGLSENGLGTTYVKTEQYEEAEACFLRANASFDHLLKTDPNVSAFIDCKGWALSKMGYLRLTQERYEDAKSWMVKAVENRRLLVKFEPEVVENLNVLGGVLNDLGMVYREIGALKDSEGAFQEAIKHQELAFEKNPKYRRIREYLSEHYAGLAKTYVKMEQFDDAIARFKQYVELWPNDSSRQFDAARRIATVLPEEDSRQEFIDLAVTLIQNAASMDGFELPDLESDSDFQLILEDATFRSAIQALRESDNDRAATQ